MISANGRRIAYQAQRGGGQSAVYVTDLRSGRATLASRSTDSAQGANRGVYDPSISGDGTKVAFTTAASNLGAGDLRGRTQVFVRDLRARTTTLVSRASGARGAIADDYSADPAISGDGRWVAFASAARNLAGRVRADGSRIYMRDLRTGRTRAVSDPREFALKPSISANGRVVAYTSMARLARAGARPRPAPRQAPARVVSRASGAAGALGDGPSADAAISADGSQRRVHVGCDEPVRGQGRQPPRRVHPRSAHPHDDARQRAGTESRRRAGADQRPPKPSARAAAARPRSRARRRPSPCTTTRSTAAATGRR